MRRKMASRVSFLPTTTSMMEATLACCATMDGGAGSGTEVVAGSWAEPAGGETAAVIVSGERLTRQPMNGAAARGPQTTAHVANILIREEFFQDPKMLRGTNNS